MKRISKNEVVTSSHPVDSDTLTTSQASVTSSHSPTSHPVTTSHPRGDKKRRALTTIQANPTLSNRAIARLANVSQGYIHILRSAYYPKEPSTDALLAKVLKLMQARAWTNTELDSFLDKLWDSLVVES